jgi:hypothetical protein
MAKHQHEHHLHMEGDASEKFLARDEHLLEDLARANCLRRRTKTPKDWKTTQIDAFEELS